MTPSASLLIQVAQWRAEGVSYPAVGSRLGLTKWQARDLAGKAACFVLGYGEGFRGAAALRRGEVVR